MRYPASKQLELIRMLEASHLPVRQTLAMTGIPGSTYYDWHARWVEDGIDALADRSPCPRSVWNRIPNDVRDAFVAVALDHEELTPRELAVKYTDEKRYFVYESSAYRSLKAEDLITAPAHVVIKSAEEFREKTCRPTEPWQTDVTCLEGEPLERHWSERQWRTAGAGFTSAQSSTRCRRSNCSCSTAPTAEP